MATRLALAGRLAILIKVTPSVATANVTTSRGALLVAAMPQEAFLAGTGCFGFLGVSPALTMSRARLIVTGAWAHQLTFGTEEGALTLALWARDWVQEAASRRGATTGFVVVQWAFLRAVLVKPAKCAAALSLLHFLIQLARTMPFANAELLGSQALHVAVLPEPAIDAAAVLDVLWTVAGADKCSSSSRECGQLLKCFIAWLAPSELGAATGFI